jgi:hypothetical protein
MVFPVALPAALQDFFAWNYPPLTNSESLSGMSGSSVYRLTFGNIPVILKTNLKPQESLFYWSYAPLLREQGVAIPESYWSGEVDEHYWLVLENISKPLPHERWNADRQVLEMLGRLHRAKLPSPPDLTRLYKPEWTTEITDNALSLRGTSSERIAPILRGWEAQYQYLFRPLYPISADPNPNNWGVRSDGSPVLFDWERFSFGAPAIDVAILIPGLPDKAAFRHYARRYREINSSVGQISYIQEKAIEEFAEDIKIAKVWVVLEFLYNYTTGQTGISREKIDYLIDRLPGWLESLA